MVCPAQTTATDELSLSVSDPTGVVLLGITDVQVYLVASVDGTAVAPGARFIPVLTAGESTAGRLHYTAHGMGCPLKITVRTVTPIASGSFTISVASDPSSGNGAGERGQAVTGPIALSSIPKDLIRGIGDCFTGTGLNDGPLLRYSLVGDPGFALGDVELEFSFVQQ